MSHNTAPRTLTIEESALLLQAVKGPRYKLITLLMLDAGLRVSEAVGLRHRQLYFKEEVVQMLEVKTLKQKSKSSRLLPLTERIVNAIRDLVFQNPCLWEQYPFGFCFWTQEPQLPLSARQVQRVILAAGFVATNRRITPHMLRHTFATRLMRTSSIRIVQELLGHKHLSSTQIYTHPSADDLTKAVDSLNCS